MRILQRLREIYASADFATSFLEAAIRKAGIQLTVSPQDVQSSRSRSRPRKSTTTAADPFSTPSRLNTLTPPPDSLAQKIPDLTYPNHTGPSAGGRSTDLFASTPPHSDESENGSTNNLNPNPNAKDAFTMPSEMSLTELMDLANDAEVTQNDFDALINFDEASNTDFFAPDDTQNNEPEEKTFGFSVDNVAIPGFDTEPKAVDFAHLAEKTMSQPEATKVSE
jgi:hypothetical protein